LYEVLAGRLAAPVLENPVFLVWGATVLCYLSLGWKGPRGNGFIFVMILALIAYLHQPGF
jgi:hypothetical protein